MTYLAYDPERVHALSTAMRDALDELATFACDDPLAGDALDRVRLARLHLDQLWLPLTERIVRTDPLARPARLAVDDLGQSLLKIVSALPGWQLADVRNDPLGAMPGAPPTVQQAAALAEVLQHGDLAALVDTPAERRWLAAELTLIATDPALGAAFAGGFDRWGELADRLGDRRRAALDDSVRPVDDAGHFDVARIDATYAAIAAIWTGVHGLGTVGDLVVTMEPYAAAATIRMSTLDPVTLTVLSVEILRRFDDRDGYWDEDLVRGPKTGDLLFETILRTSGAPTAFVIAVTDDPGLLWWTAADASLPQRIALAGADPANIGVTDAGVALHAFADWFARLAPAEQRNLPHLASPWESRSTLGALAAPWFVEYGSGIDAWGDDPDVRRADLAFVIEDQAARDALFERMATLAPTLAGDPDRVRSEQAIAAAIGMLVELDTERRIRDATLAKAEWDTSWGLVETFITYTGKAVPELLPVTQGLNKALKQVKSLLDANGWLDAPLPPGRVAEQARAVQERIRLACAATAVRAAYDTLVEHGRLGAIPPPPVPSADPPDDRRSYRQAVRRWKEANGVVPGSDADLQLDRQLDLFVSPYEEGTAPSS
ncbi:MAG: hypothetical protein QM733_08985 [Ilumatobacteraceae bacterium]